VETRDLILLQSVQTSSGAVHWVMGLFPCW